MTILLLITGIGFGTAWILWDIWLLVAHINLSKLNAKGTYPTWLVVSGFIIPGLSFVMPLLTLLQVKKVNDTPAEELNKNGYAWKTRKISGNLILWWLFFFIVVFCLSLAVYIFPLSFTSTGEIQLLLIYCLVNFIVLIGWSNMAMRIIDDIRDTQKLKSIKITDYRGMEQSARKKEYIALKGFNAAYRTFVFVLVALFIAGIFIAISALSDFWIQQKATDPYAANVMLTNLVQKTKIISLVLGLGIGGFSIAWILWDIWLLVAHINLSKLNAKGTYPTWLVVSGFIIPGLSFVMPLLTLLQVKKANDTRHNDLAKNDLAWKSTAVQTYLVFWWILYYSIVITFLVALYIFPPTQLDRLLIFYLFYFILSTAWSAWAMSVTKKISEEQKNQYQLIRREIKPQVLPA